MTDTANHPINLQKVFFTKSVVLALHGHQPKKDEPIAKPVNTLHQSKVEGSDNIRIATMRTVVNPEQDNAYAYSIEMECSAVLAIDNTLSEAEAERGVLITAHNVCYGAIREAVSWLTGRQPFGELVLGLSILKLEPAQTTAPKP